MTSCRVLYDLVGRPYLLGWATALGWPTTFVYGDHIWLGDQAGDSWATDL